MTKTVVSEKWTKTVGQARDQCSGVTVTVRPGMSVVAVYTQTVVFWSTQWASISEKLTFC